MNRKTIFFWLISCIAVVLATIPTQVYAEDPLTILTNHEITDSNMGTGGESVTGSSVTATSTAQMEQMVSALEALISEYEKLITKLEEQVRQAESASTFTGPTGDVDVNSRLNVRSGPWGTIIGKLSHGDKVLIAAKEGDWFKIRFGDGYGYVHSYYIDAEAYESAKQVLRPGQTSSTAPTPSSSTTPTTTPADSESPTEQATYGVTGTVVSNYDSQTLKITVEKLQHSGATCWISKIWVADPSNQLTKCGSAWKKNLQRPSTLAKQNSKIVFAVNCSGFYSSSFSNANHAYGSDPATYNTTGGSIVITNGEVLRNVSSVPFTGIAITPAEGLKAYYEVTTQKILDDKAHNTWAFEHHNDREKFLMRDGKACKFTMTGISARTVIVKIDQNNFYTITVQGASGKAGLTADGLRSLIAKMGPCLWAFNADGGGSVALLVKPSANEGLKTLYGDKRSDGDIFAVTE